MSNVAMHTFLHETSFYTKTLQNEADTYPTTKKLCPSKCQVSMMSKLFFSTISVHPLCNALATKTPRTASAFELFLEKASSSYTPVPLEK